VSLSRRKNLEKLALKLIRENRKEGILQYDLWRKLDITSGKGSSIVLKLEGKDLIRRNREIAGGRRTYRLFIKTKPFEIDSLLEVPCTFCEDIYKCESGGSISPNTCGKLTRWLLSKEQQSNNELTDHHHTKS
jgi:hypothetical protein